MLGIVGYKMLGGSMLDSQNLVGSGPVQPLGRQSSGTCMCYMLSWNIFNIIYLIFEIFFEKKIKIKKKPAVALVVALVAVPWLSLGDHFGKIDIKW